MRSRTPPRVPRLVRLPDLPQVVHTALGDVPVHVIKKLPKVKHGKKKVRPIGLWNPLARCIFIKRDMHKALSWMTLFHERSHVAIVDAGISLDPEQEELLCDAWAEHQVADLIDQCWHRQQHRSRRRKVKATKKTRR